MVTETVKEWFCHFHSPSGFPWLSEDLNQDLQNLNPTLYPLLHTGCHWLPEAIQKQVVCMVFWTQPGHSIISILN